MSGENYTPEQFGGGNALEPENFSYYSERDVDGDGKNDVINTQTFEGQTQTHHLDDKGEVILTEIDTDNDGILETTVRQLDERTAVMHQDADVDGSPDEVKVFDPTTGITRQHDTLVDGQVIHSALDVDEDGLPDVELFDTDDDSEFDAVAVDSDKDGVPNSVYADQDGDGEIDVAISDVNNTDGVLETVLTSADFGGQSLGEMSDFTNLVEVPADDQPTVEDETFVEDTDDSMADDFYFDS